MITIKEGEMGVELKKRLHRIMNAWAKAHGGETDRRMLKLFNKWSIKE